MRSSWSQAKAFRGKRRAPGSSSDSPANTRSGHWPGNRPGKVARDRLVPALFDDLDRIVEHLHRHAVEDAEARGEQIISALDVLADNPLIGRPAGEDRRELVIGRDSRGYVALYRYLPVIDTALILAIRAQREGGYARP